MILTCPECATSYFVDDSRIGARGRTVKCSSCGARWRATPDGAELLEPPPPPEPPPEPLPSPVAAVDELVVEGPFRPTAASARRDRDRDRGGGKAAVWIISAAAAAALIGGAIFFRAEVVRVFPASQAAYAGLGMPVSSLVIEKVKAEPVFEGGRPVLSVSGQLRNVQAQAATAAPLRVSLLDRLGKPVAIKVARPIDGAVPARAVRYFAISIIDPPAAARELEITFDAEAGSRVLAPISAAGSASLPPNAVPATSVEAPK